MARPGVIIRPTPYLNFEKPSKIQSRTNTSNWGLLNFKSKRTSFKITFFAVCFRLGKGGQAEVLF